MNGFGALRHGYGLRTFLLLGFCVAAGLGLRFTGMRHGEPRWIFHPDVPKQARVASAVHRGNLDVRRMFRGDFRETAYPYGSAVLVAWTQRGLDAWRGGAQAPSVLPWKWSLRLARFAAVTMTLAAIAAIGMRRRRWGLLPAGLTGLLLLAEPLNNYYSHYGMNDVPLTALVILVWALIPGMTRERLPLRAALAGLLLGVAVGVKYQAALGGVFLLAPWWMQWRHGRFTALAGSVLAAAGAGVCGIALTCPYLRTDPAGFFEAFGRFMDWQKNIMGYAIPFQERVPRNLRALAVELGHGGRWLLLPGLALALTQYVRSPRSRGDAAWPAAFAFCGALSLSLVVGRDFVRSNDVLPLVGFAILFHALALPRRLKRVWRQPAAGLALGLSLVALGVWSTTALRDSLALSRPDTRIRAQAWCQAHVPEGSVVWSERYVLPIDKPGVAQWRELRNLAKPALHDAIRRGEPDYVIMSSMAHARYADPLRPYYNPNPLRAYEDIKRRYRLAARFSDRELPFAHPEITVWQRRETGPLEGEPEASR